MRLMDQFNTEIHKAPEAQGSQNGGGFVTISLQKNTKSTLLSMSLYNRKSHSLENFLV